MLDRLARRYGQRPSALYNGTVEDLQIDLICYEFGATEDEKQRKK